jgi:hypothetical protein
MAERIKLVQGDNLPFITVTLTDAEGVAIDLSAVTTTVVVYFRAAGAEEILATLATTKVDSGTTGKVRFSFPGTTLDVDPGAYEGEIEIDFDGSKQTIYTPLKFIVREDFA